MFQFLFAFVFAISTVYRESPPTVGVGESAQEAKTHMNFLDTCTQLNWTAVQQLREGLFFQIKGGYTVCKSTSNNTSFLVCLVGSQLSNDAIEAGVASLLAQYNKVFDGQGKPTEYAKKSCKLYDDQQPVIESVVPAPSSNVVVHDQNQLKTIQATVTSSTQRIVRPAHWPKPHFTGVNVDAAATLNKFFALPAPVPHSFCDHRVYASSVTLNQLPVFNDPVQCVGLWGENEDLWMVMTSESALILKEKLGDETGAYIHEEQKHCLIIPIAKAHKFMQVLSDRENDETIAWMQKDPKHHFQGRIDCRPRS